MTSCNFGGISSCSTFSHISTHSWWVNGLNLNLKYVALNLNSVWPSPIKRLQAYLSQGPVWLKIFHFKSAGNIILLWFNWWPSDPNKILHMLRQLCCRSMCKILLGSFHCSLRNQKLKFPSDFIYEYSDKWDMPQIAGLSMYDWPIFRQ